MRKLAKVIGMLAFSGLISYGMLANGALRFIPGNLLSASQGDKLGNPYIGTITFGTPANGDASSLESSNVSYLFYSGAACSGSTNAPNPTYISNIVTTPGQVYTIGVDPSDLSTYQSVRIAILATDINEGLSGDSTGGGSCPCVEMPSGGNITVYWATRSCTM